nr:MAG TPA: hypothetical protein [Caudoviricetes sp.]
MANYSNCFFVSVYLLQAKSRFAGVLNNNFINNLLIKLLKVK